MQRREQSGLLPAGAKVQILQPSVLQTDVLQDLSGALTSGAQEQNVARERDGEEGKEKGQKRVEGG